MLRVAITGGICSGKTTICKSFSLMGVPIFNTNDEVKLIYSNSNGVRKKVISLLGVDSYSNGKPNLKYILKEVFQSDELKNKLTHIIYPELWKSLDKWYEKHKENKYVLIESALIFELNLQNKFDKIILIYVDREERITRAMHRDGCTREDIVARIKDNIPEELKINLSNYVIRNQKGYDKYEQICNIHNTLTKS